MHSSIVFDKSVVLSDLSYHQFLNVNFFSINKENKVVVDNDDIFPTRIRDELGRFIGFDSKQIYKLSDDMSKSEVLYSSKKRIKFVSSLSSRTIFFDKKHRGLICFDEEFNIQGRVKAEDLISPKSCFYNGLFYEFLDSEIIITSFDGSIEKCAVPESLGSLTNVYYFESFAYLEFYRPSSYALYKFYYNDQNIVKVFLSEFPIPKPTVFNGKEYFLSSGSLYSLSCTDVAKVADDVGDIILLVDGGIFFYKEYSNKISYMDSDNNLHSVCLPAGFVVADIIPSAGNLSAIQITTASGYEAFGIIPIYNLYINDMKDFFSLSNISMIEENDDLITEEKETDRGALIRLDIGFMDVFTAAQVVAGLTFSAFYKYCYRSDLAGANFPPESDKEIEGLFLYSIHKDFSECDRKLLISIVEEIFSYYLSNNIVYLENKNLRFEFE